MWHTSYEVIFNIVFSDWLCCLKYNHFTGIQAGLNHFHTGDHKKLVGTFRHPNSFVGGELIDGGNGGDCDTNRKRDDDQTNAYPEYFDARYHWFDCPSISHIWNQGNCAADWVQHNILLIMTKIRDLKY